MRSTSLFVVVIMLAAAVWCRGTTSTVALSEFVPIRCVSCGWGDPKWSASVEGNPLTIHGQRYKTGLGTHAPSELLLKLDGTVDSFHAWVGVDDEIRGNEGGSVEFIVQGDGSNLWRSGVMRVGDAAKEVRVPLAGVHSLLLVVTEGGDDDSGDHADWADATCAFEGAPPVAVWKEETDVLDALADLRAYQHGQFVTSNEAVAIMVNRIEHCFPKIAKLEPDARLRRMLDALADSGDLPAELRKERQFDLGSGRRTIWLDQLGTAAMQSGWESARIGRGVGGEAMKIGGKAFSHGIGTHAVSSCKLRLFGQAERFTAQVGIDDETEAPYASVEFIVRGDGNALWSSGVMHATNAAKAVDVSLKDVDLLELEVTDAGDGISSDHADWADAQLVLTGRAPQLVIPPRKPGDHGIGNARPLDRIAATWESFTAVRLPAAQIQVPAAATNFPGPVDRSLPRVTRRVPVDIHVPFWQGSGLYAAPGERVTVRIPAASTNLGLKLQISCFTDELWARDQMNRAPEISNITPLDHVETIAANGFGGMIYLVVPALFEGKAIDIPIFWKAESFQWVTPLAPTSSVISVEIQNAVEAPRYVRGQTDAQDWRRRVLSGGVPVAELEGRKIIWTMPTALMTNVTDPEAVCAFWDDVMDHMADLAAWPRERVAPFRFVLDREISVGGGHSGYPLMAYEDWCCSLDIATVRTGGTWGAFHEIGHDQQWSSGWNFQDQDEVSVNLFSLYANEQMCGWKTRIRDMTNASPHDALSREKNIEYMKQHFSRDAAGPTNVLVDLQFYVQLIDAFGWEPMKKVIASYTPDARPDRATNDVDRAGEYMVRLSKITGKNLYPFMRGWGLKMPAGIEAQVKDLPVWLPDVAQ